MRLAILFTAGSLLAGAQSFSHKIDLPPAGPIAVMTDDWHESNVTARGGAFLIDVHAALSLKNVSQRRIRGVTLAVQAQEVTPGGKASFSVPSLDIAPGDTFPFGINVSLLRPLGPGSGGPMVEVKLDGVLFDDLTFYGSDKLHSRRTMTVAELEARRDRQYFKKRLEQGGQNALQREMLDSLGRQADRPQPGMQMVRGRTTNTDPEREVQFAFLHLPESPVEPKDGIARISGNEAQAPRIEVRNRSDRDIRYLEIGWIVKDQQGREFIAASMPADLALAPGKSSQVVQDAALRFPERTSIQSMTGFISNVEFADGTYWIPSRTALEDPVLRRVMTASPEEQRLASIYRRKGLPALIEELKKF